MSDVIAGVTILIEDRKTANIAVNDILAKYASIITGRMGIPHLQGERSVISIILQGDETAVDSLVCELTSVEKARGFRTVLARFEQ
ncbi:MAG TPA: TM1266 family iron-only hydrogenase system putative regulator [Armatimonadota bacterium]|nr:TM1266 family iron-only hydrogenase system putative regulator [Armatimonadota bacterium]